MDGGEGGGEDGGEDGSESDEDQMAAQGLNFFSITKKNWFVFTFQFSFLIQCQVASHITLAIAFTEWTAAQSSQMGEPILHVL